MAAQPHYASEVESSANSFSRDSCSSFSFSLANWSKLVEYLPALTVRHVPKAIRVLHDRLVYSPLGAWASYVWQAVVGEMAIFRRLGGNAT